MTPADKATANAVNCEMVLYAYRKSKDGIVVSFVLHPNDVPDQLAIAALGSRWVSALVQIGDDELPVQKENRAAPRPERRPTIPQPDGAKRMDWRELQPAAQAGIRCEDPVFKAFLDEKHSLAEWNGFTTAEAVRAFCGVKSRAELSTNHKARVLWHQLDSQFQAWKAVEHA